MGRKFIVEVLLDGNSASLTDTTIAGSLAMALPGAVEVRVRPLAVWDDDEIQFPRLLAEIVATQDKLDIPALCDEMDLDPEEVWELFERAQTIWDARKEAQHGQ